jgi:hypothetical protein
VTGTAPTPAPTAAPRDPAAPGARLPNGLLLLLLPVLSLTLVFCRAGRLGSQGDPWDTQWDTFLGLVGGALAMLLLRRPHERSMARLPP